MHLQRHDRLKLLDRIADRVPELDPISTRSSGPRCRTAPGLLLDGGGMDGGNGYVYVNYGEDLHAYGPTAPLLPGGYGCVSIDPDGNRRLLRLVPDPLAHDQPE